MLNMKAIKINDSIESFTEYLEEVNNYDEKYYRKLSNESSDSELAEMILSKKIETSDLCVSMIRMKSICPILERRIKEIEAL